MFNEQMHIMIHVDAINSNNKGGLRKKTINFPCKTENAHAVDGAKILYLKN